MNRITVKKRYTTLLAMMLVSAGCASSTDPRIPEEPVSYENTVVSYLGPEGTYTQEACMHFFDEQGSYVPYPTVNEAVEALVSKESDYAVIPQENTIGGAVVDYVDVLIAQTGVSVVGEVELPINQNLLVLPGTSLEDIQRVYSHSQGIVQGAEWLQAHLPDAELIVVSSTAEGAKMVAEGKDPSCAAIASAACAEVYGLEVLAEGIQNNTRNRTRFYVLSMDEPSTASAERIAFIVSGDAKEFPALMADMEKRKMTLIAVHDRPMKTELGQYCWVIECADSTYQDYLELTKKSTLGFRWLGSFHVK